jgi:hypothetical protein
MEFPQKVLARLERLELHMTSSSRTQDRPCDIPPPPGPDERLIEENQQLQSLIAGLRQEIGEQQKTIERMTASNAMLKSAVQPAESGIGVLPAKQELREGCLTRFREDLASALEHAAADRTHSSTSKQLSDIARLVSSILDYTETIEVSLASENAALRLRYQEAVRDYEARIVNYEEMVKYQTTELHAWRTGSRNGPSARPSRSSRNSIGLREGEDEWAALRKEAPSCERMGPSPSAGAPAFAQDGPPTPQAKVREVKCLQCTLDNDPANDFCEVCGYDLRPYRRAP